MVEACSKGIPLICPADASTHIRADVVRVLCLGLEPQWPAPQGVQLKGATIVGLLDLQDRPVPGRLILDDCVIADGINACFASLLLIDLTDSTIGPLLASHVPMNTTSSCLSSKTLGWQVHATVAVVARVQVLERAYRLAGWFFTALAAAALVGLLRKE
jgi:hypothetical protein